MRWARYFQSDDRKDIMLKRENNPGRRRGKGRTGAGELVRVPICVIHQCEIEGVAVPLVSGGYVCVDCAIEIAKRCGAARAELRSEAL